MLYFDNAATTFPKPGTVREAVCGAMDYYGGNPGRSGHRMSFETAVKVYETREAAANLFSASAVEDVVFTSNCTHALNFAIKGVLKPGDHVIISDLEHNSSLRPVHALYTKGMISYSVAEIDEDDDGKTVEAFRKLINSKTKMIITTHASNVWGIRAPIERIGRLALEYDLLFMVDAAQTAGVVPIDMQKMNIDFLCTAGHKSLYGPAGTGLLITPLGKAIATCFEGGTGSMSADFDQPDEMPDRMESGTVNTSGIIGLGAGIKYVTEKTPDKIYRHSMQIAGGIFDGLKAIKNIQLYTKGFKSGRHLPVMSFNVKGIPSEDVTQMLSDAGVAVRGGLHCAPLAHKKMGTLDMGAVRVSVGSFNTMRHAQKLLCEVQKIAYSQQK